MDFILAVLHNTWHTALISTEWKVQQVPRRVARLVSIMDHMISIINLTLYDLPEHFNVFYVAALIANKSAYVNKLTLVSTQRIDSYLLLSFHSNL